MYDRMTVEVYPVLFQVKTTMEDPEFRYWLKMASTTIISSPMIHNKHNKIRYIGNTLDT